MVGSFPANPLDYLMSFPHLMPLFTPSASVLNSRMSSLEEEASPASTMESTGSTSSTGHIVLVRGGALTPFSGLGGAHATLVEHHRDGRFPSLSLREVVEYPVQSSAFARLRMRWSQHPKRVAEVCKRLLGPTDVLHITDQEQAHLVPPRSSQRPKVVVTVHDVFHLFPSEQRIALTDGEASVGTSVVAVGDQRPGMIRRRDLKKLKAGLARADLLVCDSEHTRQCCEAAFPDVASVTVPLGLDLEAFAPGPGRDKNPAFTMLYVGSADPRKRRSFLEQVLRTCKDDVLANSVLHVVGDRSPEARTMASSLKMEVVVHPRLDDQALMDVRHGADLLLFPSAAEGYGYPPVEAMAAGCPVLCSDLPAHNELMPEGSCLPAGDIAAWREAVEAAYRSWDESKAWAPDQSLMEHARTFSSEAFVERMNAAYDHVLNRPTPQ